jgi:hypothetical protein
VAAAAHNDNRLLGEIADSAGTGIKANPAVATTAPPSITLKTSRRSIAVNRSSPQTITSDTLT